MPQCHTLSAVSSNTHPDGMPCQDSKVCRERDVRLLEVEMLLELSLCEVVKEFKDRILENMRLGEEAGKRSFQSVEVHP